MCGRLDIDQQQISDWSKEWLGLPINTQTNHDLRPTQTLATIGNGRQQVDATWGIQPTWAKKLLINAQGETVAEKKTFRSAFAESRCLVPCSGWYEWRDEGGPRKQKYHFSAADGSPLLMGGILLPGEEGPKLVTLTIDPNKECAEFHHRMPQFVSPRRLEQWLSGSTEDALQLVAPMPAGSITIRQAKLAGYPPTDRVTADSRA